MSRAEKLAQSKIDADKWYKSAEVKLLHQQFIERNRKLRIKFENTKKTSEDGNPN